MWCCPDSPLGLGTHSLSGWKHCWLRLTAKSLPRNCLQLRELHYPTKLHHQREPQTLPKGDLYPVTEQLHEDKGLASASMWDNSEKLVQLQNSRELSLVVTASHSPFPGSLLHTDPISQSISCRTWPVTVGNGIKNHEVGACWLFLEVSYRHICTTHPFTLFVAHLECTISKRTSLIVLSNASLSKSITSTSSHFSSFYAVRDIWIVLAFAFLLTCSWSFPLFVYQDVSSRGQIPYYAAHYIPSF